MRSNLFIIVAALALPGTFARTAHAQINMGAGSYSTSFDSLATNGTANSWTDNSTLPGWYAAKSVSPIGVTTYRAGTGTETTGALYSFGPAAATERSLGSLASGTPGNLAIGLLLTNETALLQTNITITCTGEQWRNGGNTTAHRLRFYYQTGFNFTALDAITNSTGWIAFTNLDFVGPIASSSTGALDGNSPVNRVSFNNVVLTNVSVPPGAELFLRWVDVDDTGNDHGLAIDDFSINFTGVTAPLPQPPSISSSGEPQSRTNNAGTTATFTVSADGTGPFGYQWRRDGFDLFDGGNVSGSTLPTLTLTNLLAADAAGYSVVVTNSLNSVTSQVATLKVVDPALFSQPVSRTNVVGDVANFVVGVAGTKPLDFQWRFNGLVIPTAVASILNTTNVQATNQGGYALVVTNSSGVVTSGVATLTVVTPPATRLARWDFNSVPADANPATGSTNASEGTGSAWLLGTNTASFSGGTSSDPAALTGNDNSGWNTATYPAQGTGNKTGGIQFNASTVGFQDILLTWEQRHSPTASRYVRVQYSTDGISFVDHTVLNMTETNGSFVFFTSELSGIPGVNNNPIFAFRIVTEYENSATGAGGAAYVGTSGAYGSAGTIRFDALNVYGNVFLGQPHITSLQIIAGQVQVDFTAGGSDLATAFTLVNSSTVDGNYDPTIGASIVSLGGGSFRATAPLSGGTQFYRIKH